MKVRKKKNIFTSADHSHWYMHHVYNFFYLVHFHGNWDRKKKHFNLHFHQICIHVTWYWRFISEFWIICVNFISCSQLSQTSPPSLLIVYNTVIIMYVFYTPKKWRKEKMFLFYHLFAPQVDWTLSSSLFLRWLGACIYIYILLLRWDSRTAHI